MAANVKITARMGASMLKIYKVLLDDTVTVVVVDVVDVVVVVDVVDVVVVVVVVVVGKPFV
jgi:hypothetical protein